MTLEKADKIVNIFGKHMEHTQGKLIFIFSTHIPESFLPFPRDVLEEALNIVATHHYDMGNQKAVELIQNSIMSLSFYKNDEEAVLGAAKLFNDPAWCETVLPAFKKFQKDWIRTQGGFENWPNEFT